MNGNYEFVKQIAQDKQRALAAEASVYRLARVGRERGGDGCLRAVMDQGHAWLQCSAHRVAAMVAHWSADAGRVSTASE